MFKVIENSTCCNNLTFPKFKKIVYGNKKKSWEINHINSDVALFEVDKFPFKFRRKNPSKNTLKLLSYLHIITFFSTFLGWGFYRDFWLMKYRTKSRETRSRSCINLLSKAIRPYWTECFFPLQHHVISVQHSFLRDSCVLGKALFCAFLHVRINWYLFE